MKFEINKAVNGFILTVECRNGKDERYVFDCRAGLQLFMSELISETWEDEDGRVGNGNKLRSYLN